MEKQNYSESTEQKESKAFKDASKTLDLLESAVVDMNKSSRLRGFFEGCLVTAGVVGATGLIVAGIIRNKQK